MLLGIYGEPSETMRNSSQFESKEEERSPQGLKPSFVRGFMSEPFEAQGQLKLRAPKENSRGTQDPPFARSAKDEPPREKTNSGETQDPPFAKSAKDGPPREKTNSGETQDPPFARSAKDEPPEGASKTRETQEGGVEPPVQRNHSSGKIVIEVESKPAPFLKLKGAAPEENPRGTQDPPLNTKGGAPSVLAWVVVMLLMGMLPCSGAAWGQLMDKPVQSIDEEVTAFAYAPDGRVVFSVRRMFKAKKYDLQRDDIFILEAGGKKRRILEGQKFTHGDKPFTYQVEAFTWSPNGHVIAVQLFTTTVDVEDGHADDARALLLLDDGGRELRPNGKDPLIMNAENPLWLRDNATIVYLTEEVAPRIMFGMQYLYLSSGLGTKAFEGRTFADAERIPGSNSAIAVERDRNMDGPARLQRLELLSQEDKELATLEAFAGGLSVSPGGNKVAYFLDKEVLEIRDLAAPEKVARLRVGLGVLQWSGDETRIYLKRTVEKKSADLASFAVPALVAYGKNQAVPVGEPIPVVLLHGLAIREYGISPDGRFLGVVLPGKRNLQMFGF